MASSEDFSTITYEIAGGVGTVTLNRPDRMNAFNATMRDELIRVFDLVDADDDVRAVVVTGQGKAFCAGADLSSGGFEAARADTEAPERLTRDSAGMVTLRIFDCRKPVIAAINGAAVGFGASVTLAMDVRLASDRAKVGFVFAHRGIVPDGCASWFLPRLVGVSRAAEWAYTGRLVQGQELVSSGLVTSVYEPEELLPAAYELADRMSQAAPVSIALTRQLVWRMLGAEHPMQAHVAESRALYGRMRSADAREGVTSFLEKRPAEFPLTVSANYPDVFADMSPSPRFPLEEPSADYLLVGEPSCPDSGDADG